MNEHLGIGSRVKHQTFGAGVVIQVKTDSYEITFIEHGIKNIMKDALGLQIIEAVETPDGLISYEKLERRLIKILRDFSDIQETVPMAGKWTGGKLILQPSDNSLKEKEMPIEAFFHKIVMIRDRLRVMEQRVNSSDLEDEEKVNIQQYITRIYGSLTSFNILFKNKDDNFVGDKKE